MNQVSKRHTIRDRVPSVRVLDKYISHADITVHERMSQERCSITDCPNREMTITFQVGGVTPTPACRVGVRASGA